MCICSESEKGVLFKIREGRGICGVVVRAVKVFGWNVGNVW